MNQDKIGFIGFGEAASLIAEGLHQEGIYEIFAYDEFLKDSQYGHSIRSRALDTNVVLVDSLEVLAQKVSIIFNATSAKAALSSAENVKPFLQASHLYIDLNATTPMVQEQIAHLMYDFNFIDVAIMDPVPLKKHQVPMLASGRSVEEFKAFAARYHMDVTTVDGQAGSASAIKMIRSIFMKGFTMLLLETLQASHKYGVTDTILQSLEATLASRSLEETANLLINRTAVHAQRRIIEMASVQETLHAHDIDAIMSQATKDKLQWLLDSQIQEKLKFQSPNHYTQILGLL